MSDVPARSSPVAPARYITPSIPSAISPAFHPAIAMYLNASADSLAEYFVFKPISLAFFDSISRSVPVAPDIDWTVLIPFSKSAASFTDATPIPAIGAVTVFVRLAPTPAIAFPDRSICFPAFIHCLALSCKYVPAILKGLDILSTSRNVTSTIFPIYPPS